MSIRPVDYQVLIPRTQQQSIENQLLNDKLKIQQQQIVQQDKKNTEIQQQKINPFERKNNLVIKDSPKHQSKNQGQKNNDKENDKDKEKQAKNKEHSIKARGLGKNIDIKI